MIKINLLPKERRRRGIQVSKPLFILLPAVGLVVAAMVLGWWYLDGQAQQLQQEVARSRAELKKYEADIKKVEQFRADKRRLATEQEGPVHLLDQVSRALPEEVWLTGLNKTRDKLTLQGYAFSNFGIANFMTELGKSRPLSIRRVELSFSEKATVERVPVERFEVTAEVGN